MLADAAKSFGGKLYVHGGGWNYLDITDRAFARPITIIGRILFPIGFVIPEIALDLSLEHSESEEFLASFPIVKITLRPHESKTPDRGVESATPFVIDIPGIVFSHEGDYAFVMHYEGEEVARTRFRVDFVEATEEEPPTET